MEVVWTWMSGFIEWVDFRVLAAAWWCQSAMVILWSLWSRPLARGTGQSSVPDVLVIAWPGHATTLPSDPPTDQQMGITTRGTRIESGKWKDDLEKSCKAERRYLLTSQISRYCILGLHWRIAGTTYLHRADVVPTYVPVFCLGRPSVPFGEPAG